MIRNVKASDATAICAIYNYYVLNSTVSFEEEEVLVQDMEQRISSVITDLPWLVFELEGVVVGYAYATKWRVRSAYRFSVETSVYIDHQHQGKHIGTLLYTHLLERLERVGVHAVIGGIAQPNEASIALHEKLGFKKVAHFKEVGFKFGEWIDTAYWEKIL